jgi:hypothetical protein
MTELEFRAHVEKIKEAMAQVPTSDLERTFMEVVFSLLDIVADRLGMADALAEEVVRLRAENELLKNGSKGRTLN